MRHLENRHLLICFEQRWHDSVDGMASSSDIKQPVRSDGPTAIRIRKDIRGEGFEETYAERHF